MNEQKINSHLGVKHMRKVKTELTNGIVGKAKTELTHLFNIT